MERHVATCKACRRVRHRVTRASDSFATIRSLSSPEVPWDEVRARVHWSVSTERRAALRQRRPAYGWLAGALAGGVTLTGGFKAARGALAGGGEAAGGGAAAAPLPGAPVAIASGVHSDGLITIVFPAASAGPIFQTAIISG